MPEIQPRQAFEEKWSTREEVEESSVAPREGEIDVEKWLKEEISTPTAENKNTGSKSASILTKKVCTYPDHKTTMHKLNPSYRPNEVFLVWTLTVM